MTSGAKQTRRPSTSVSLVLLGLLSFLPASWCRADSYAPPGPEEIYNAPATRMSLDDYIAHLHGLRSLLVNCTRAMSAKSCDWKSVGADVEVQTSSGIRKVQFVWLRSALRIASNASSLPVSAKDPAPKQTALTAASDRLRDAALQLDQQLSRQPEGFRKPRNLASERAALTNILSHGGYAVETPPTLFERLRDEFLSWLDRRLSAIGVREGSQWIVDLLLISFIVVTCGAMIWWFARQVRSPHLKLTPGHAPAPSAPSYQDWQKWLDEGRAFARERRWREAIHHVYWSAISRLESRGLWPADRARTPREYIGLLAAHPESLGDLDILTRSFERTWYGDQAVGEAEFDQACALLERLAR